uniref:RING finger protein 13 n=1 Tax=Cajanus cajan TaxID=3821 RepID=A0A151SRC0_CAJCA|nr:RING finger protein 13 [Cajanus cajan]
MEEHSSELQVDSARDINGVIQKVTEESSLSYTEGRISCSPRAETATPSDTRAEFSGNTSVEGSSRNITNSQRNCLSEHEELVPPYQVSAGHSGHESRSDSSNTASTSFVEQQSSDPVSVNVSANKDVVNDVNDPVVSGVSQVSHETMHPRSSTPQEHGNFGSGEISVENHTSAFISIQNSSNPVTQVPEDEPRRETIPSGLGILVSNRERGPGNDSVLQVDVVTISSNILSGSSADDPGSQDRWLVDFGSDLSNDGVGGASGYMGSRIHRFNERMRHSRSEIWERLRGGFDEIGRWNSCPLGLHADGMCSCESSPMAEESSTRASISRIVMLAEALFEVLDEIHRQPGSLSLSMVSLPAPESIVDSFPLRSHKKVDVVDGGNDVEQCYICLAEYEEGDQIRVLPCFHEYHKSCVDKWLKEIHGVCPLCRGNVCGGFTESSAHSEVQSH